MNKYEFSYSEYRTNEKSGITTLVPLVRYFFAAENPKEMRLKEYQKMLLAIVDMPLYARVLCGFVEAQNVAADFTEERFSFRNCTSDDLLTLYNSIENFLLKILYKQQVGDAEDRENLTPIDKSDLAFLREYLTDNNCENYTYNYHLFIRQIALTTFLDVSDKWFYENWQIAGKDIFEVCGRKFFLPANAIIELCNQKGLEQVLGKGEFEQAIQNAANEQVRPYTTWEATTAIDFYTFSQNFDIIHQGVEISQDDLNEGKKIAFENSAAAMFACLSREIESIDPNTGKLKFVPTKKAMKMHELEQSTSELIDFFNSHLTMDEVHQCNFFFANTINPINNIFTLLTKNQPPATQPKKHPKNKK